MMNQCCKVKGIPYRLRNIIDPGGNWGEGSATFKGNFRGTPFWGGILVSIIMQISIPKLLMNTDFINLY